MAWAVYRNDAGTLMEGHLQIFVGVAVCRLLLSGAKVDIIVSSQCGYYLSGTWGWRDHCDSARLGIASGWDYEERSSAMYTAVG